MFGTGMCQLCVTTEGRELTSSFDRRYGGFELTGDEQESGASTIPAPGSGTGRADGPRSPRRVILSRERAVTNSGAIHCISFHRILASVMHYCFCPLYVVAHLGVVTSEQPKFAWARLVIPLGRAVKTMEWWTTTNGVQEFMSDARAGKAAVLVGAGVSIPAPTQLPSGLELRDAAVGSLLSMAGLGREWQSLRSSDAYKAMVPEEAFEQCTVVLMDELIPFFGFIAGRMPNVVHQALSSVLSRFDVLAATTNFDTFIEDSSSTPVEVIHLHGSVRSPSSLVVRLNQVGRGLGRPVVQQIRSMLEGRRLWVFGYSGADRDVMDVISEEARTIVWHYLTRHE